MHIINLDFLITIHNFAADRSKNAKREQHTTLYKQNTLCRLLFFTYRHYDFHIHNDDDANASQDA